MYFAFIYDHKYLKSDRDFYGDAIVYFHPSESIEKYIYMLGQLIGSIDFFKGFMKSSLDIFKLDKLIFAFKKLNSQFLLILATDSMTLTNELTLKRKVSIIFNLLRLVNGPIIEIDRLNESGYASFKTKLSGIARICFGLVLKPKKVIFNSYFESLPFNLQLKLELECKRIVNHSIRNLHSFSGVLFYNNKVLYSKIKNQLMINLLHLISNEDYNLSGECESFDDKILLPSGCHLLRIYVSKKLYDVLKNEANEPTITSSVSTETDDKSEADSASIGDDCMQMDAVSENTRFTTMVTLTSLDYLNYYDQSVMDFEDDDDDDDDEQKVEEVDEDDDADVDDTSSTKQNTDDTSIPSKSNALAHMCPLIVYIQKNSRFKLILISDDTADYIYQFDNTITIWQSIVTYFSTLECEIMEWERNENGVSLRSNRTNSSSSSPLNAYEAEALSMSSPNNSGSFNKFWCMLDRNRHVKSSSSPLVAQSKTVKSFMNQSSSSTINMSMFYELMQSMPELSRLQINKKGVEYSYFKQNKAGISSSTLHQHVKLPNSNETASSDTIANTSISSVSLSVSNKANIRSVRSETTINNEHIVEQRVKTTSAQSNTNSSRASSGGVNQIMRISPESTSSTRTSVSIASLSVSDMLSANFGSNSQYGDVLIKCTKTT